MAKDQEKIKEITEKALEMGALAKLQVYQSLILRLKTEGAVLKPNEVRLMNELEKLIERPGDEDGRLYGMKAAAEYCGISKRMIAYHLGRGKFAQNADGSFSKAALDKWLALKGRKPKPSSPDILEALRDQKEAADLRYRLARAYREELLIEQMKGTVVPREEVLTEWTARVLELKSGLMNWKDRLAGVLAGKDAAEIRLILEAETWLLLDSYSRFGTYCPQAPEEVPANGGNGADLKAEITA